MSDSDETFGEFLDKNMHAHRADRDQRVAVLREKIARIVPELDPDPVKARKRLSLVFQAAAPEVGPDALAEVLADYVMRERERP